MLKVERSIDYLKGANLEITEPIEEEQNTQQSSKSFQPKPRIRRQYSPNDNNLQLLSLIARYKKDPALINDIKGLLNKVDINYRDKDGDTFLHAAIQEGHQDVVKLILEKVTNIDIENNAGKTSLRLANELDNRNPNKQSIIQVLDTSRQKDDKRKRKQSSFDQDNSSQFAEKTLNQQDYQAWLTQEDVANIARIKYGWHGEDGDVIFEVIGSVEQLSTQLGRYKETLEEPSKQSLTFIVNLSNNHWVTLVITYHNAQFSAYYVDSLGNKITSDIQNQLMSSMQSIKINDFQLEQQKDSYNCGVFALENAKIINAKIQLNQISQIGQLLEAYKSTATANFLENKRKEFAEKLKSSLPDQENYSSRQQKKRTRTDSDENTPEDSSLKKPRTSNPDHQPMEVDQDISSSRKRTHSQENQEDAVLSVRSRVDVLGKPNEYSASGLKRTLHGNIYQLKLLMLFLKRGLDKGYSFRLATEMDDAEKFDDLVFQYENERKDGIVYRFLQAKHKQDESKKITANDLLTEKDKEFSLQKYFISYRKIKQSPEFNGQGNELKDFVICTNIDLSDDLQNSFERVVDEDNILDTDVQNNSKEPKRLKFRESDSLKKESLTSIFQEASDLKRLAKKLAEHVFGTNNNDKTINLRDELFKKYHGALAKEVIDTQTKKFKIDFVNESSNLSEEIKKFRKALLEKSKLSEDDFKREMQTKDLKIPDRFGNVLKLEETPKITKKEKKSSSKTLEPTQELAKKIVDLISKKNTDEIVSIEQRASIIKENIAKLAGHVFIETEDGTIKFRQGFLDGDILPENLNDFREELKTKLSSTNKRVQFGQLDQYQFKINIHTCTEEDYEEYKKDKSYFERFDHLPDDEVRTEEINEFLDKLVFAVNQPNEVELSNIIKAEMGEDEDINLIDSELIASKFQENMLNWMKEKKGRFFTHENGKAFFKEAKQKISKLVLIGPTLEYRAKIEEFGIAFSKELSELSNFLNTQGRKIFNLVNLHKTILSSIKVYQTLKDIHEYQKDDSYIFIRLSSLLRIQDRVIKAFESRISNNLLVIECKAAEENVDELYSQLSKVTRSSDSKKIILITQENDPLASKFKDNFSENNKYEEKKDERNSLIDLTDDSQQKLLEEGKVMFQGKEVSLGTLIDDGSKHLLDGEVLTQVINEKRIKIGSKVPQKSDRGSPAYNIIMPEEIKTERFKNEDIKDDLFVISKIKEEKLINLGITEEKICSFDNCDLNDKNTKQFFLLNSKDCDKNIEDFETVCHNYPDKVIHFIEFKDNKFMWNRYYDPDFHTSRKFYQIEIDATELRKYATKVGEKKDIFVVSGIKKEGFEKKYKIDKIVIALSKDVNLDGSQPIIVEDEEKDFSYLSGDDKLKGFNIHWLENKETKLVWKRSKGKTSKLSEEKLVVRKPDLTHDSLLDIVKDTKSTVIADSSGAGKSTTLTLLSESYKKKKSLDWVVRVNLRDYSNEIDKLLDKYNLKEVVEFFSAIDKEGLEDTFAKKLFKYRLEKGDNILLLFDGFDEISSRQEGGDTGQSADKQEKITNLLKFLKDKTKARIVVTTRPYEKEKTSLENELSILSYTFKPIENERDEFLKNFWKRSLKLKYSENEIKESQYKEFAKNLIGRFDEAISDEKSNFTGIPLHLRMLAEVYLKEFEKFCNDRQNDDFKDLNIFDLYKEFVDRKYKIYFSEKTGLSSTGVTNADLAMFREQCEKMHKRLAFKYLFSGSTEPFKLFFSAESEGSSFIENKMLNEEKTRELKRIGITQSRSKDDIDFVHRTFAEYFVSKLIYERLKQKLENPNYSSDSKDKMREFLLNQIFIKKENNVIRSFINSELVDKFANLENFWSGQVNSLEKKEQLLLAVKEGLGNIFSFLLRSKKDKGINKELISVPREHIKELCNNGEYREANLLSDNALKFLIKELEKDHLEVAIMQGYRGNAYGTLAENTEDDSKKEELFKKKKEYLEEALSTFEKHLGVATEKDAEHRKDYFQQALSTFKEDFKSIEAQTTEEDSDKMWIRALEIEIAKTKRNLANAYGDLAENTKDDSKKEELFKKKKEYLEEALSTFKENFKSIEAQTTEEDSDKMWIRALEIEIAKTKRNLANAYGDLAENTKDDSKKEELFKKKKEYLEEALSTFEKYEEKLRIAETKRNLGNVCGKLAGFKNTKEEKEKLFKEKKKHLEEALPVFKKHYGLLDSKVTKAQENLSKAYKKLEYPLHAAVILGDKNKVEKELEEPNVNINYRTIDDLVTPLYLAVREGHPSIVKLLLVKGANPNIPDNNGKPPLDLAKEQLNLNSQIYQKIIDILKSKFNNQLPQGGEVSSEECLSTSHNRRKREVESGCLFTWEDVDEFNEEKGEKRDFSRIEIDSEKFVNYIKDLSEEKCSQLIQLASEAQVTGRSQGLVNKLTSNQKVISHLNRVGRISGMTMHGMMAKNVLADFLNGDYQGVAINVGFIAGGQGFAKVAEAASLKGLKLASEGKLLLSRSLRAASPFLARGTSAFVIYDLVNQVKAFKNGTEEALAGVIGDSIYLGVDAAEIGIEVAEAFEVLEGVSSVTGPIGATIGAVVFVGTDIYMAVKRVDKIDEIIHLTGKEKFAEGLRAFIGMQPEEHIQELLQEKQVSNQLVRQGLEYLKQHNDIQSYVFPTGKSIVDSCRKVPYKTSNCASGGFGGGCLRASTVTRYAEECTTKFEVDLDNTVLLDEKRNNIKWSRARPDDPSGGELFCLPRGNHERVPSYGSYLCENAIGITDLSAKTGNHTLINLGKGTDHAKGFIDSPNIFVVNNGSKRYFGGNKDDIFILQGSSIKGYFYGEGGINTLDLTSFAPEEGSIDVELHIGQVEDYYRNNFFGMSGINKFLGRKAKADQVFITCDSDNSDIKFVDGQSGSEEFVDHINIHDKDCAYEMQVVVRSNTIINNRALKGDFHYIVPYALGSAKVDFIYTAEALNLNNTFVFEYEPAQIKNVDVRNINALNKTSHIITFNFSPMSDKEFNITISGASNPSYRLGNNTEIKVGNKGNLYMLENANKSVDEIIRDYLVVANRLNKMSFFIQSLLSNETVTIGSGNYEVIHNNPLQKSHLVGNGGENVYVIDSKRFEIPLPEVVIYDLDVESSVDTIDLRSLVQQARGEFSNSFKLQVLKSANDLLLKATVEKSIEDSSISKVRGHEYFTVRLKDGVNWYNKTHVIMDNVPMRISLDSNEWSLKPQPLMFEKDKEVIVVTSQDIEENTELITPKRAGNYTFVRDHGSDLIITNAFNTQDDLCTIVLSKFYEIPKMETLSIKFADKEIVLKDKQKEINAARDVDIVKREHKKQVYSDVFNHSPEIMLSDQPHRHEHSRQHIRNRRMVSSSAKPSSWINDLFGWVKSSIGGLLGSKPEGTASSISQVDGQIDVDGAIMLLDLLVRKVTGQKYVSTVDQPISSLEAQGYTLNIIEKFEKVLNETAIKSGISVTNLNFDPVAVQSAIVGQIINGRFSEISKTLYSSAKEACPEFKQTDKFLAHFRSSLEGEKEVVLLQQKVEKPSKILDQQVSRKVELSKKPDTFLNGTSVVKGISNVLER